MKSVTFIDDEITKVSNFVILGESLVAISEFLTVDYKQSTNW